MFFGVVSLQNNPKQRFSMPKFQSKSSPIWIQCLGLPNLELLAQKRIWGFPKMGLAQVRWMISDGTSPFKKWMRTRGNPIFGNLHMANQNDLVACCNQSVYDVCKRLKWYGKLVSMLHLNYGCSQVICISELVQTTKQTEALCRVQWIR
jgi:hypothetical protein